MSNDVLTGLAIAGLILAVFTLLRYTYSERRAAMTKQERDAEDTQHDSDQIW